MTIKELRVTVIIENSIMQLTQYKYVCMYVYNKEFREEHNTINA